MRPVLRQFQPSVFIRIVLILCLSVMGGVLFPALLGGSTAFAQAQEAEEAEAGAEEAAPQQSSGRRSTPALREKIYKKLSEAQAKAEADDYATATKIINEVKADTTLNSYE